MTFNRVDRESNPRKQTGRISGLLGLAIVQQIVKDLHGTIVYITEPQKGTTFTISFPVPCSL